MRIYRNITELIGGTPLLELTNYERKNDLNAAILAKLEYCLLYTSPSPRDCS